MYNFVRRNDDKIMQRTILYINSSELFIPLGSLCKVSELKRH